MAKTSKKTDGPETTSPEPAAEAPESVEKQPEAEAGDESLSALAAVEAEAVSAEEASKVPASVVTPAPAPVFDDSWMAEVDSVGTYRVAADGAFVGEHGLLHRLVAGTIVSSMTHDLSAIRGSGVKLDRISD